MSPKKSATKNQSAREDTRMSSDAQVAPVDDYPEKNDDIRTSEETAIVENRPPTEGDGRDANAPDLTAADVERLLNENRPNMSQEDVRTRAEEIDAMQNPSSDNTTPDE